MQVQYVEGLPELESTRMETDTNNSSQHISKIFSKVRKHLENNYQ